MYGAIPLHRQDRQGSSPSQPVADSPLKEGTSVRKKTFSMALAPLKGELSPQGD